PEVDELQLAEWAQQDLRVSGTPGSKLAAVQARCLICSLQSRNMGSRGTGLPLYLPRTPPQSMAALEVGSQEEYGPRRQEPVRRRVSSRGPDPFALGSSWAGVVGGFSPRNLQRPGPWSPAGPRR
ncbi:hypothetical protein H1C71_018827, partial [Ictidomys tridecemlineatus]